MPAALADRVDHLVLTVADIERSAAFYERALGLQREVFEGPDGRARHALRFGAQKINLQDGSTVTPTKAARPTAGSGDFCLVAAVPLAEVRAHLEREAIALEAGPVARQGALGPITSLYFRDPDGNLVEIAEYAPAGG